VRTVTGTVFAKGLRDQRRGLVGWGLGTAVLVILMCAMWPSIRDIPDLDEFLTNYPEAMQALFDIETITTPAGFLNAELFSIIVPAMFIIFAIARGARLVAGDEEAGTLEVVLATPVSRTRVLLEKAAVLSVSVLVLSGVLFVVTLASAAVAGMEIGVSDLLPAVVAMALLALTYGYLAVALGASTGRRSVAFGVAGVAAVGGYVLYIAGKLVTGVEPWSALSPFTQALDPGPIGGSLTAGLWWTFLVSVGILAVSVPLFENRDLAAN
jgi:ABC-2 type transport system permease protein